MLKFDKLCRQRVITGGVLDEDVVNFKTFASSFVMLVRLSTSAGWNDILDPLLIQPPDCNEDYITRPDGTLYKQGNGDCGTPWLAYLFIPHDIKHIEIILCDSHLFLLVSLVEILQNYSNICVDYN
jgi:hypothetical protein